MRARAPVCVCVCFSFLPSRNYRFSRFATNWCWTQRLLFCYVQYRICNTNGNTNDSLMWWHKIGYQSCWSRHAREGTKPVCFRSAFSLVLCVPKKKKKKKKEKKKQKKKKKERRKKRRHTDKYRWKTEETGEKGGGGMGQNKWNNCTFLWNSWHFGKERQLGKALCAGGGGGGGGGFSRSGDCQHKIGE